MAPDRRPGLGRRHSSIQTRGRNTRTVGILAYGSLIDDPEEEIGRAIIAVRGPVLTPFTVEFARKSSTRKGAPTLVPVERGGAQVQARILVLDVPEEEAANRLYRREIRKVGSGRIYKASKTDEPNKVTIKRLENFQGVDAVFYTSIGANIEPLTATELARLAIVSVREAEPGMDGISYLIRAKQNGIRTALSEQYEQEILRLVEAPDLEEALVRMQR
jgi:cation transport regulator ChaC